MKKVTRPVAAIAALAASAALAAPATAATPTDTSKLQAAVAVGNNTSGIRKHLKALQLIADASGGNRATSTPGHEASVKYVEQQLATAGSYWKVTEQPFSAAIFEELAPPTLTSTPSHSPAFVANTDFATMDASGSGGATGAPLVSIDFAEPTTT